MKSRGDLLFEFNDMVKFALFPFLTYDQHLMRNSSDSILFDEGDNSHSNHPIELTTDKPNVESFPFSQHA